MEFKSFVQNTEMNPRAALGVRRSGLMRQLQQLWQSKANMTSRLTLVERIAIGPRQSLLLVEADGVRLLVATSPEGAPSFFPLAEKNSSTVAELSDSW